MALFDYQAANAQGRIEKASWMPTARAVRARCCAVAG
jgi:hypothetical protein